MLNATCGVTSGLEEMIQNHCTPCLYRLHRFPTELEATFPRDSLSAYFCPLLHMHRNSTYHTPHQTLPARCCLILQPQTQFFVQLNLSLLSATVFLYSIFSLFLSECVSALLFVCTLPSSEGAEVTENHLWPLCLSRQQQRFININ